MQRITRRLFLKSTIYPMALPLAMTPDGQAATRQAQLGKDDLTQFRAEILRLVNTERLLAGIPPLEADDFASLVADRHALDMATGEFLSHWGRDGRKPYHRYSLAGGSHAVAENASAVDNLESLSPKHVGSTLAEMHMKMHGEIPPNDGHRRTILAPQYTHVGFGVSLAGRNLRLVEMYVAKYVQLEAYLRQAKPRATVQLTGKLLSPAYKFGYAEVFYEPLPRPPEMDWLRVARSYGLPDEYVRLRPKPPRGTYYADRAEGKIDVDEHGKFRIPVNLYKDKAGIYTVAVWISGGNFKRAFQATNACIQVD